jgi:nickel-dependent lactate racemase
MKVDLAYGRGHLTVELPEERTTVIEPAHTNGLPDERSAVLQALDKPISAPGLKEWIKPGDRICIVFTDITRATPNDRLIPWLLEYLSAVPPSQITLLNGLGTHRPNTRPELEQLLTPKVVRSYRVLNHEPENPQALVQFGCTRDGNRALLNRHLVEADVRIITGFIEPHFFAGFSGGPKGIMPGVAGLETVMSNHDARQIADPSATFGITDGNPIWEEMRDIALRPGPSFLLNVALNEQRQITGVFAGDLLAAHVAGCAFVKKSAMQPVKAPFDVVITTNSGYPLDLNLYQGVKGMSAAARILKPGGTLILACECRDGVPAGSSFDQLLRTATSPEEILTRLATPGFVRPDQWQAQIQALIQRRARILLYSSLADEQARAAHLAPCHDIGSAVQQLLTTQPPWLRIGVLPQGPLTIPYLTAADKP